MTKTVTILEQDKEKGLTKNLWVRITICVVIVILIIIGVAVIKHHGTSDTKREAKEGYQTIYDVLGVSFEVKKELSDYSTALTEISGSVDFRDTETYSFKNGKDTYLLFNIKEYIVIVAANTSFHFAETGVEAALGNNSIDGIWFSAYGENPMKQESNHQYTVQTRARVVITNTMYNDFYGLLTTIEKDGVEWSMFAGYTSEQKEKYSSIAEYSVSTFQLCDTNTLGVAAYTITEDGHFERLEEAIILMPAATNSLVLEIPKNQKKIKKDKDKVYLSSIYNMLSIGETGYVTIKDEVLTTYQDVYARATRIYDAKETDRLIENHIKSGNSYYTSMEAPPGTHFEAVEYDVNYLDKEASYVNVQLCGMDGEALRYRGVIYEKWTYDIHDNVKTDGDWQTGYIAFYAVPNGCKEYVLKIGEGNPKDLLVFSAYYEITEEGKQAVTQNNTES